MYLALMAVIAGKGTSQRVVDPDGRSTLLVTSVSSALATLVLFSLMKMPTPQRILV